MQRLTQKASGLTTREYVLMNELATPIKIQDYLDTLAFNWEKAGETHRSPRRVIEAGKAHCIEGALFAAAALWLHGERPLIMNLSPKMNRGDFDHVVALYKRNGYWGAIGKTNHAVLRFRDPVYKTLRELAVSFFNEWYLSTGEKLLECYSKPLDLTRFGTEWLTSEKDLWHIADALSSAQHYHFIPKSQWRYIRPVDPIELEAGAIVEWPKDDPRT